MLTSALAALPDDVTLLGIDEETALVGGPHAWQVVGRQSVWIVDRFDRREHRAGSSITTP
jgi:cyanophycinase-like exopeptidase